MPVSVPAPAKTMPNFEPTCVEPPWNRKLLGTAVKNHQRTTCSVSPSFQKRGQAHARAGQGHAHSPWSDAAVHAAIHAPRGVSIQTGVSQAMSSATHWGFRLSRRSTSDTSPRAAPHCKRNLSKLLWTGFAPDGYLYIKVCFLMLVVFSSWSRFFFSCPRLFFSCSPGHPGTETKVRRPGPKPRPEAKPPAVSPKTLKRAAMSPKTSSGEP